MKKMLMKKKYSSDEKLEPMDTADPEIGTGIDVSV
jgi:hypothetical protein